jgi:hypothetical protein
MDLSLAPCCEASTAHSRRIAPLSLGFGGPKMLKGKPVLFLPEACMKGPSARNSNTSGSPSEPDYVVELFFLSQHHPRQVQRAE